MLGRTHEIVGLAGAAGFIAVTGRITDPKLVAFGLLAAAAASLFPDLDEPHSTASRALFAPFPAPLRTIAMTLAGAALIWAALSAHWPAAALYGGIALLLVAFAPHRGMTHSIVGLAATTFAVFATTKGLLAGLWPFWAIGYGLHLVCDSLTDSGIPWLWPYPRHFGLRDIGPRFHTGGALDFAVRMAAVCVLVIVVFAKFQNAGW